MDDEKTRNTDATPNDADSQAAYQSLNAGQTNVQPTQVNPAAAHYAQQQAPNYQVQGGAPRPANYVPSVQQQPQQAYQQQTQQSYSQQAYQQQARQQAYQQAQQQQAYQQAQQQRAQQQAYQQAQQQAYQRSYQQPQAASQAPVAQHAAVPQKKQHVGLKSAFVGFLGGALGALAVTALLQGANFLNAPRVVATTSGSGQTITIDPKSDDITIPEAVAAKALPSVCAVHVATMQGSGLGSGVVLDTDGNVLTNWHVAGDATTISVTIGGKSYDATLVGGDASSDLAVVHAELNGDEVTPMEIGDSDALKVGEWVMTIGSPFGLDQSVSAGVVSSLARNEMMQSTYGTTLYANLIQTDASINPGNSGGALVNSKGQLVGISTLFSSDTESFAGIGFAIPGNYAVEIANMIIKGEQVTHAYIGLSMQTVNAQNAAANNLSVNQGAYVAEVAAGSPAEAAGIQVGDIVIGMGKEEITSADGMILAVRSHRIGETVPVTVMRGEEKLTFDVTLGSDEALQALQQQQLEEQRQLQEQYLQEYPQGDGTEGGNGEGGSDNYEQMLEELYEYLYNNNHGGVYEE